MTLKQAFINLRRNIRHNRIQKRLTRAVHRAERMAKRKKAVMYVIHLGSGRCLIGSSERVKQACRMGALAYVNAQGKREKAPYIDIIKNAIYTTK